MASIKVSKTFCLGSNPSRPVRFADVMELEYMDALEALEDECRDEPTPYDIEHEAKLHFEKLLAQCEDVDEIIATLESVVLDSFVTKEREVTYKRETAYKMICC